MNKVYEILVNGTHRETCGTWSQAEKAIKSYAKLNKKATYREKEIKK